MKTFEGFPHIGERFGHKVDIEMDDDRSTCNFSIFRVLRLRKNAVGLLEREVSDLVDAMGFVSARNEMHVSFNPSCNGVGPPGYLLLSGADGVKDLAGVLIWVHAKCMELMEGK